MILPDVNLLVFAYCEKTAHHPRAKAWWEATLCGPRVVHLPWAVSLGFIRLMTHPRVVDRPMAPAVAVSHVQRWLAQPQVRPLEPGPRHLEILAALFRESGVAAGLTTDAHLAALALEHGLELHSHDRDFDRFSGLRRWDPLA